MAVERARQSIHGGTSFNGVDAGGLMAASIDAGYDNVLEITDDGLHFGMPERLIQYVRGTVNSQDIEQAVNVFNHDETGGPYTFYTRESEAATYTKNEIVLPVIHAMTLNFTNIGYSTVTWSFECRATGAATTFAQMWTATEGIAAPAFMGSDRAIKIESVTHTAAITKAQGVTINVAGTLLRESMDGDLGYTDVEATDPYRVTGSVQFQEASVAASAVRALQLLTDAEADLVFVMTDSGGAGSATWTLDNVIFTNVTPNYDSSGQYVSHSANFVTRDDSGTPLTTATFLSFA